MKVLVNYFKGTQVECLEWACVDNHSIDFLSKKKFNRNIIFDFTFVLKRIVIVRILILLTYRDV